MASSTESSKTVFTADVVEFNFLPEKYAEAVSRVVAELRVHIETDWQASVDKWYSGLDVVTDPTADPATTASTQLANATYRERIGQVLTSAQQELIVRGTSKVIENLSLPALFGDGGAQALVGEDGSALADAAARADIRKKMAKQIARGILYQIAKDAGYYTGTGVTKGIAKGSGDEAGDGTAISTQFKNVLQAILSNSATSTQNNLTIAEDKVKDDLGGNGKTLEDYHAVVTGNSASSQILDGIKVTQETPVSKLQHLLSASAFAPVINRWVSGGNFSRNVVDGTIQDGALTSITIADFAAKNKATKGGLENGAYSGVEGTAAQVASEGGPGTGATFNLTVGSNNAGLRELNVAVSAGGSGYAVDNTITINNNAWGGSTPADANTGSAEILKYTGTQLVLTVSAVGAGGAVTEVTHNFDSLPPAIAELAPTEKPLVTSTDPSATGAGAKATVAITSDPATGARVMTASLTASGAGYDTTNNVTVALDDTAGGSVSVAFSKTVDEGDTGFHFDLNNDTAGNTNNIHKNSELVFPVKIVVADAGMVPEGTDMGQAVTLSGSNESADAAINAMEFQLNIILSNTKA